MLWAVTLSLSFAGSLSCILSLLFLDDIKGILEVDLYGSRNPQLCRLVYRDGQVFDFKHNSVFWRLSRTWGISTRKKYTFIKIVFFYSCKKSRRKSKNLFKGTVSSTSSETPSKNDNGKNIDVLFYYLFSFVDSLRMLLSTSCFYKKKWRHSLNWRRKTISRVSL